MVRCRGDLWSPAVGTADAAGVAGVQSTPLREESRWCAVGATSGRPPVGTADAAGVAGVQSTPLREESR